MLGRKEWNVKRIAEYKDAFKDKGDTKRILGEIENLKRQLNNLDKRIRIFESRSNEASAAVTAVSKVPQKLIDDRKQLQSQLDLQRKGYSAMSTRVKYTHCSIAPNAQYGVAGNLIPGLSHNPAPRVTFQTGMSKATIGGGISNQSLRYGDGVVKSLAYPNKPLWNTSLANALGLDTNPQGVLVTVAIMFWGGWGKEDAFVLNKRAVDAGKFDMYKETEYSSEAKLVGESPEKFEMPPVSVGDDVNQYNNVQENGLPLYGARLTSGNVIIGKSEDDNGGWEKEED